MPINKENDRYQFALHKMHIATQRNQFWWGLCPIAGKPRLFLRAGDMLSREQYEAERKELAELRRHWYLAWCFTRPPGEKLNLPDWLGL